MILHIFIGISGSGKSTVAKSMIDDKTIRINRDDLRTSIAGSLVDYYKSEAFNTREVLVSSVVDCILDYSYSRNLNVIIDNTNLKASYLNKFIRGKPKDYEVVFHIFHTKLEEAKVRVSFRDNWVNTNYIEKQHEDFQHLLKTFSFEHKVINYEL